MNPKAWVEAILELIWRICLRIVLWAGLAYFLFRVRSVIAAILIAAVLTYAVLPIVDFLCAYRVRGIGRRFQRLIATLLVFITLAAITGTIVVAFFAPFQAEFNGLVSRLGEYATAAKDVTQKWYNALPPDVQAFLRTQKFENILEKVTQWSKSVFASTVDFVTHLVDIILIPVLAFYFTLDSRSLKREFVALVPRRRAREALAILHEINCIMRSYVIGQIILCVIAGAMVGIVLSALDMQYVLILSVFAGITRAVPVVGPIVSGAAIVILGLAKSPFMGLNLLVFFALLQFVESKFIMPKLIGDRMQLHPALIIIVLLIGAEFFGVLGMFLAAPVASVIRVLVRIYLIKPKELRQQELSRETEATTESDPAPEARPVTATQTE